MKRKPLQIGSLTFEYPFVLAPLAGITDRAMRSLCSCAGASLTFTEMVSAKGLWYGDRKTGELLQTGWPEAKSLREGPVGFQLFGCEPLILGYAVHVLSDPSHAKAVDATYAQRMSATFGSVMPIGRETDSGSEADFGVETTLGRETTTGFVTGATISVAGGANSTTGASFPMAGASFPATGAASPIAGAVNRSPMGARTADGLRPPAVFDLNAGCPVPKIVRNGEGSALLKDPDLLYECVRAMVQAAEEAACGLAVRAAGGTASGTAGEVAGEAATEPDGTAAPIPVTVKIRKGFEAGDDCAVEIAKAAEAAGAAAVTVHGRTRQQYYEGKADWDAIARVKAAVRIPVIGNGDVMTGADAIRMMEETGCDGVMIARGALGNPWIFRQVRALWDAGVSAAEAEKALKDATQFSANRTFGQANAEIPKSESGPSGQTNAEIRKSERSPSGQPKAVIGKTADSASSQEKTESRESAGEARAFALETTASERCMIPGLEAPTEGERIRQLLQHIEMVCQDKGERVAVREMRKHVGWYIKGMRGATQIRRRINTAGSVAEMAEILSELTDEGRP